MKLSCLLTFPLTNLCDLQMVWAVIISTGNITCQWQIDHCSKTDLTQLVPAGCENHSRTNRFYNAFEHGPGKVRGEDGETALWESWVWLFFNNLVRSIRMRNSCISNYPVSFFPPLQGRSGFFLALESAIGIWLMILSILAVKEK